MPIIAEAMATVADPLAGYERYAEPNWDCYGAKPITAQTVEVARQLLHVLPDTFGEPRISPGSDGTIGFEWVSTDGPFRKLYIDVGPGRVWGGYWRRASGERHTISPKPVDGTTEAELGSLFEDLNA
jgi:hypothetical protein